MFCDEGKQTEYKDNINILVCFPEYVDRFIVIRDNMRDSILSNVLSKQAQPQLFRDSAINIPPITSNIASMQIAYENNNI
jgi:hypothetical protein